LNDQTPIHGWLTLFLRAAESRLVEPALRRRLRHPADTTFVTTGCRATPTTRVTVKGLAVLAIDLHRAVLETKGRVVFACGRGARACPSYRSIVATALLVRVLA